MSVELDGLLGGELFRLVLVLLNKPLNEIYETNYTYPLYTIKWIVGNWILYNVYEDGSCTITWNG